MRKGFLGLFVMLFTVAFLFVGCSGGEKKDDKAAASSGGACACGTPAPAKAGATCSCADLVKTKNGWCDHCGMGMVNGAKTTCMVCAKNGKMCDACTANGGKPCPDCQAKMPK